jgi:hypothetical protein
MTRKQSLLIFFIGGLIVVFNSCYYDKEQLLYPASFNCSGVSISYSLDVAPLIQRSCAQGSGCHGAGSASGPGPLTTYTELKNAGAQVLSSTQAGRMPLGSSLSPAQIKTINCWMTNGMLNN